VSGCELIASLPVGNILGEGIIWDERGAEVWWTDIESSRLYRYAPQRDALRHYELPERLGSFGFIADDQRLVCAFASGFALYDPDSGAGEWLARPEQGYTGTRFNDGRVDRRGRFWAGTMVESDAARDADGRPATASLYRLSGRRCQRMLSGIAISNSLCFSPDQATLYFADSPTGAIRAFEIAAATGDLGPERPFAAVRHGVPDGSTIDAEGCLWNAQWGGGRVVRYAANGSVDCELELPVSQPTCICFGGEQLDRLFVTTATAGLAADKLAGQPDAGHVLIYHTPFRGLPESRFRL
jgi:sugar lactone lactonase YvrE